MSENNLTSRRNYNYLNDAYCHAKKALKLFKTEYDSCNSCDRTLAKIINVEIAKIAISIETLNGNKCVENNNLLTSTRSKTIDLLRMVKEDLKKYANISSSCINKAVKMINTDIDDTIDNLKSLKCGG